MEDKTVIESLYRLMRNLRRRPSHKGHPPRSYMRVLRLLSREDGRSSRELSEALDIRPSSLSQMLDKMERDQAILREKDPSDMRVTRVSLTEAGKLILSKHHHSRHSGEKNLERWLSEEEQRVFKQICDKLSHELEQAQMQTGDEQS